MTRRADGGGFGPWDHRDPHVQEMWQRRARHGNGRAASADGRVPKASAASLALIFLLVAGSLVAVVATLLSFLGPLLAANPRAGVVIVLS